MKDKRLRGLVRKAYFTRDPKLIRQAINASKLASEGFEAVGKFNPNINGDHRREMRRMMVDLWKKSKGKSIQNGVLLGDDKFDDFDSWVGLEKSGFVYMTEGGKGGPKIGVEAAGKKEDKMYDEEGDEAGEEYADNLWIHWTRDGEQWMKKNVGKVEF